MRRPWPIPLLIVACSMGCGGRQAPVDRDHDGLIADDQCPDAPEDMDGFEDDDGGDIEVTFDCTRTPITE